MTLENAIILITGSADRVGKSTALLLAQKGARVIIHYHTSEGPARQTVEEVAAVGPRPLLVRGDLSRREDWERLKAEIQDRWGPIDALVNNAAIFYHTPFRDVTEAQWDQFMNVNLKSVFLGSQLFGELMYQRQRGKIVNIADISTERVWPGYIPYCVSKAGVVALTRGLAKALAPHVTVNAVAPGAVLLPDDYGEEEAQKLIAQTPLRRLGSPEDIAQTIAFLLEGSDYITGTVIPVDGGQSIR